MGTKKENKNAYKQMKFRVGIFMIKNIKNDKLFLQTSLDLDRAYSSDEFQLKMGMHSNSELQTDWNLYGADSFIFDIYDELKMQENADDLELKKELKEFIKIHKLDLIEKGTILY